MTFSLKYAEEIAFVVLLISFSYGYKIFYMLIDIAKDIVAEEYRTTISGVIQQYANEAKDVTLSSSEQERRWSMSCGARGALHALQALEEQRKPR